MTNKPLFGRRLAGAAMAACVALTACDGSSTGPEDDDLSAATAQDLATFVSGLDASAGTADDMTLDPRTASRTFSRTASCPDGGTYSTSGSSNSSFDPATRILSTDWEHTQTHDDCAVIHTRGDREVRAVIDGSITVNGAASYLIPESRRHDRTILSYSSRRVGSTTTTVGDRTRSCDVDVTKTYDPDAGTFTVSGVMCGREVDVTFTPGHYR
jgi:hypothetical protein